MKPSRWPAHVYGGLVECERCHRCPLHDYLASIPPGDYDDLRFGFWLLNRGWKFEWHERSRSWSFAFTCPECDGQPTLR